MKYIYKFCIIFAILLSPHLELASQIFFDSSDTLWVLNLGAEEPVFIADEKAEGIAVDTAAGYIFWTESVYYDHVKRSELDGSNVEVIYDQNSKPNGIDIDPQNQMVYWADNQNDAIMRATYEGEGLETIIEDNEDEVAFGVLDLALDHENEKVYWVNIGGVHRADFNGDNIETVVELAASVQPPSIAFNSRDNFVYWVNPFSDYVERAEIGVWDVEEVFQSSDIVSIHLDLEDDKIYWVNDYLMSGNGGEIQRANLDGSNIEHVLQTGFTSGALNVVSDVEISTSIKDENSDVPNKVKLLYSYPNPFNPQTTIKYELSSPMTVNLDVFNMLGQKVESLVSSKLQQAGVHEVKFDATHLSSGVYIYQLSTEQEILSGRMTLIK